MASAVLVEQAKNEDWTDEQVVGRVLAGETALFELLMRRHNRRLYRVARAILRDDAEAEDVMQDAYVRAYQNLASFEGRAKFATWLTRIAVHEALARCRKRSRFQSLDSSDPSNGDLMNAAISLDRSPEEETYDRELSGVLEKAVLSLSDDHRLVFMFARRGRDEHRGDGTVPQPDPAERQGASASGTCQAAKAALCDCRCDGCAVFPVSRSAV